MRPGPGDPYGGDHGDPYRSGESLEEVVDRLFDPLTDPLPEAGTGHPHQGQPHHGQSHQGYPGQGPYAPSPGHPGGPGPGGQPAGPGPQHSGHGSHRRPPSDGQYHPGPGGDPYLREPSPPPEDSGWFSPHTPPQGGLGAGGGEPVDPLTDPALSYRGAQPSQYEPAPESSSYEPFPASDHSWFRDERSEPGSPSAGHPTDPHPEPNPLAADPNPRAGGPFAGGPDPFGEVAATPDPFGEPRTERFPAARSPAEPDRRARAGTDRAARAARAEDSPSAPGTDGETRAVRKPAFNDETVALRTGSEHGRPLRADAGPPLGEGRAARRRAQREGGRAATATEPVGAGRAARRRALKAQKPGPGVIASRVIGELFITCGVLMLLFVTYQLWWTNVLAQRHAAAEADHLQEQWAKGDGKDRDAGKFSAGEGFAIMYIPKLDVRVPIAEGISKPNVLDKGMLGHYSGNGLDSAMPWDETGNFAVAGHRNTHGEPFRYINKLVAGDAIVVETKDTFYTYEMANRLPSTPPSNVGVINPIPEESGFTDPGRYITLTTCTPEFTSKYRLIVWGKMVDESPRSEGKPDALVD